MYLPEFSPFWETCEIWQSLLKQDGTFVSNMPTTRHIFSLQTHLFPHCIINRNWVKIRCITRNPFMTQFCIRKLTNHL